MEKTGNLRTISKWVSRFLSVIEVSLAKAVLMVREQHIKV